MAVLVRAPRVPAADAPRGPEVRAVRRPVYVGAAVMVAMGAAAVVGRDGTLGWRAVRVAVVAALAVLTIQAIVSWPRVARGAVMTSVGLVTVPVGVGIGPPYLMKAGASMLTFAGLAVLAGGAVLLVGGTVALAGAITSRWRRAPVVVAVPIVLLVLVWSLGQAVAATNTPRPGIGSITPADRGLIYRDVTFAASDGVTLSGWYVPGTTGAAVVLLHGAGSTRDDVLDHAVVLARHGYGVLLYDARGHGRSDGRAMDFGWYGDRDIAGAVAFLQDQAGVETGRIGAIGMSMGGEQAIGAAASIAGIGAVVGEGATNRVAADKAWLSDEFGWQGSVTEGLEKLTYGFADLLTDVGPPISLHDAVQAAAPRPVLLIAAEDVADEPLAGRYIQSASPGTVDVWVAPDTTHTQALDTHPVEWERRVTAFLDRALGVQGGEPAP